MGARRKLNVGSVYTARIIYCATDDIKAENYGYLFEIVAELNTGGNSHFIGVKQPYRKKDRSNPDYLADEYRECPYSMAVWIFDACGWSLQDNPGFVLLEKSKRKSMYVVGRK